LFSANGIEGISRPAGCSNVLSKTSKEAKGGKGEKRGKEGRKGGDPKGKKKKRKLQMMMGLFPGSGGAGPHFGANQGKIRDAVRFLRGFLEIKRRFAFAGSYVLSCGGPAGGLNPVRIGYSIVPLTGHIRARPRLFNK